MSFFLEEFRFVVVCVVRVCSFRVLLCFMFVVCCFAQCVFASRLVVACACFVFVVFRRCSRLYVCVLCVVCLSVSARL